MILEKGVAFSHTDEADFEAELAFEKRVAEYARPRIAAARQFVRFSRRPKLPLTRTSAL